MRRRILTIWAILSVLLSANISQGVLIGYVSTQTQAVWTDFETGQQTPLGPSGIYDIRAMDVSPDGTLYVSDDEGYLWTIDKTTGAGHFIGDMGRRIDSISFAPDGTLYAIHSLSGGYDGSRLRSVDTQTAAVTQIGSTVNLYFIALAINNTEKAIGYEYFSSSLYEISLTDGSVALLGNLDVPIASLDFGPDDNLYGLWHDDFYRIDLNTLTPTLVRELSISYFESYRSSLTFVPEPSTLLLLGLGTLFLRRKHSKSKKM